MSRVSLERVNLLELAPVRLARWEEAGGRVVVERPRPRRRGLRALGEWLGYLMAARRIRLDEIGSYAWKRLDGRTPVREIAAELEDAFGERVAPADDRLGRLVRMLHKESMVGYPGLDEPPDPAP